MATADIVSWSQSKFGFYVDRHFINGRWVLKPGPIKLADYHARILRHCFTPDEAGRLPYDTIAWCEPAKSGKSAIAGLVAEYVALHGEQNSTIVMASNKQNQAASIMFKSLTDSVTYNPHLPNIDTSKYEVGFSNGNVVKAIASNSRGAAGERFSLAVFDELAGYIYTDAERLWNEFKTDPTRANSLKFAIGYAGYSGESELWQNLLETGLKGQPVTELADIVNGDGPACWANGRLFVFWSHVTRQPWQTQAWLDSQAQALTPAEYRRMIKTEFVPFTETAFCPAEWWDSCYDPLVKPAAAGDTTPLVFALDLASGTIGGDNCALAGVARWGERDFVVKFAERWQPDNGRFDYETTVKPALDWLIANCAACQVNFDPYQAINFMQQYQGRVWAKEFNQTNERAMADKFLYDLIASRRLHHDGNPALRQHVLNAGSKAAEDGKLRLVKVHPHKKIDLAVCLSMACYRASQLLLPPDPASLQAAAQPPQQPTKADYLRRAREGDQAAQQWLGEQGYDIWHGGMIPAQAQPAAAPNGPVKVRYEGYAASGSFFVLCADGEKRPVLHDQEYLVSGEVYANLKSKFPTSWWEKIS